MEKKIKITGVTRCCRQKLLEKMYLSQDPFSAQQKIELVPSDYRGRRTFQLFVNDIDIGFVPPDQIWNMNGFSFSSVTCEAASSPTGRIHYSCFLIGQRTDSKY